MGQKIHDYFGIELRVDRDVNTREYKSLHDQLVSKLKALDPNYGRNAKIYIHKLKIDCKTAHFGVMPVTKRLSRLDVSLLINKKVKEQNLMWFLNPDLDITLKPEVQRKSGRHKLSYSLSADYCSQTGLYEDYIATVVADQCRDAHRKLTITATAHATDSYRVNQLKNNQTGKVTTSLIFPLDRDIQLALDWGASPD